MAIPQSLNHSIHVPRHHRHSSADNLTRLIPHDWHMGARRHKWDAFLADIFPSEELRRFVQRAVGYSLLGDTSQQVFFICWGSGANGKSTFLNTLLRVLGRDYATQADPRSFMAQQGDRIRSDLARLHGARFVSAIELGEGKRLDEAVVKSATGGDPIVAEHKYHDPFEFTPEFKLWLATNHRPVIRGTDHAIWRRVRLIPFTVTIDESKRNTHLEEELLQEAEGILDWAVDGAVAYRTQGLQSAPEIDQATAEYRQSEDHVGRFLAECVILAPYATVSKADFFAAYKKWCEDQGEYVISQKRLGTYLMEKGFDSCRKTDGKRVWIGLGLNESGKAE